MMWNWNSGTNFMFGNWWGGGLLIPLVLWSLFWAGFALWYAARRGEKWWFIAFLLVHTAGILEIIYLLFVAHAFEGKSRQSSPLRNSSRRRR